MAIFRETVRNIIKRSKLPGARGLSLLADITALVMIFYTVNHEKPWPRQFMWVSISLLISQSLLIYVVLHAYRHKERAEQELKHAIDLADDMIEDEKAKVSQLEKTITILENRLKTEVLNQEKMAEIFHNYAHKYRSIITNVYFNQGVDHYRTLKEFLVYMMANIKEIFDITSSDNSCAVCVKLLQGNDVRTLVRDSVSERPRSQTDGARVFDYRRNTAFRTILDSNFKDSVYRSNDLQNEIYENANLNWRKLYNATLVVPIRILLNEETNEARVIGFICVDNFKGGFTRTSVDLLASFSDLLFHMWHLIDAKIAEQEQVGKNNIA
jgi:hypothetical protein